MGEVIFLIFGDTGNVEAFHEIGAFFAVAIDDVIDRTVISAFEDGYMEDIGSDE